MLFRDFFLSKRQYFHVLFVRQIFLNNDFILFIHVLSVRSNIFHAFRLNLKERQVSIFFLRSSLLKHVISNPEALSFVGAHCYLLYTNSVEAFYAIFSNFGNEPFFLPYAFIYKQMRMFTFFKFTELYELGFQYTYTLKSFFYLNMLHGKHNKFFNYDNI